MRCNERRRVGPTPEPPGKAAARRPVSSSVSGIDPPPCLSSSPNARPAGEPPGRSRWPGETPTDLPPGRSELLSAPERENGRGGGPSASGRRAQAGCRERAARAAAAMDGGGGGEAEGPPPRQHPGTPKAACDGAAGTQKMLRHRKDSEAPPLPGACGGHAAGPARERRCRDGEAGPATTPAA